MIFNGRELSIIEDLAKSDFRLTAHAAERLRLRSVTKDDIISVGRTAKSCTKQKDRSTFKVIGVDADGEDLIVICGYDGEKLVVTVY